MKSNSQNVFNLNRTHKDVELLSFMVNVLSGLQNSDLVSINKLLSIQGL